MPRIQKDYSNRRRTPIIIGRSEAVDRQKMSGNGGSGGAGNSEKVIAHEKAKNDRAQRRIVPNSKLGKK
jgi:hypothetical protein